MLQQVSLSYISCDLCCMLHRKLQYIELCLICFLFPAEAYTYGDIRLFLNGSASLNNSEGVIEIFIDGEWGTVCILDFNLASAAAACRQLGFIDALSFDTPMEYGSVS